MSDITNDDGVDDETKNTELSGHNLQEANPQSNTNESTDEPVAEVGEAEERPDKSDDVASEAEKAADGADEAEKAADGADEAEKAADGADEAEKTADGADEAEKNADTAEETVGATDKTEKSMDAAEDAVGDSSDSGEAAAAAIGTAAAPMDVFVDKTLAEAQEKKASRRRKLKKVLCITGITCAAVIVCAYAAIAVWFYFHCNYKTYINGVDFSFYSVDDLDGYIHDYMTDYALTLKMRNGDEHVINAADINLEMVPSITAREICDKQNSVLWPYYMSKNKNYDLSYSAKYDKDMLVDLLSSFDCLQEENMEQPENAYLTVTDGEAVIVSETKGTVVDIDKLSEAVGDALAEGKLTLDADNAGVYVEAEITSDNEDLVSEKEKLSELLEMVITFEIDEISWELTSEDYGSWIEKSTVNWNGSGWAFSRDKIKEYVQELAEKYDTYGDDREFTTHSGDTITVSGAQYGWLIDVDSEADALKTLMDAGNSAEHTPVFDSYAAVYTDDGDIGDSYVEVNFTEQHIYVYIDGKQVMDSDCVTGSIAGGHATPEGVYTILFKKTPALLIGADYETPVTYWIPFIGELGIGFHDATWRGKFGGEIYKTSGSHGCVNLPYEVAKQLYNTVYAGMPVICYY